jgi:FK506-binding protein 4/5
MTRGECALLLCSPAYGYGQRGSGPIPAASWLLFTVELLDWHERNQLIERLPAMVCYAVVVLGVLIYLRWMRAI